MSEDNEQKQKLFAAAVDKFHEAVSMKRNHHYALFNWAEALREWSKVTTGIYTII